MAAAAFALLLVTLVCLIAASPFNQIAERSRATRRQDAYTKGLLAAALAPFALALGADVVVALTLPFGPGPAWGLGAATTAVALWFWYGLAWARRRGRGASPADEGEDEALSTEDKIKQLLREGRIVLPGAQALLGFQFAAYLTESFERLSTAAKAAHTSSLFLIALATVMLMAPAPYHRLAENGEATERFHRVGARLILAALVPLGLGLAGDLYVVLEVVSGRPGLALLGAVLAAAGALGLWFGVPLLARRR